MKYYLIGVAQLILADNLAKAQRQNVVASANIYGIDAGCW